MPLTFKQIERILKDFGYGEDRQTGSHRIYRKNNIMETVPVHKELSIGTAKNILSSIASKHGVSVKDLVQKYGLKL